MKQWAIHLWALTVLSVFACGCGGKRKPENTFDQDVAFLREHTDVVVLREGPARVAVVPQYQGRVMTSTTGEENGPSFGWLNYEVIERGLLAPEERKGSLQDHIHVFGGEERFWLGPEGGQFGIYFAPGVEFTFENWHTPAAIDTAPYRVLRQTENMAIFLHRGVLTNHSGTVFSVGIKRTVRVLDAEAIRDTLDRPVPEGVAVVAYESENILKNDGPEAWTPQTGMLSIWLLGMYKPTPETTIVIPVKPEAESALGPVVNDAYFGAIPDKHLRVRDHVIFFKGDGKRRGKIGVSPARSKGIAGSYDAVGRVLTLVTYNVPPDHAGYVNSMWEQQSQPFNGDAINAYNDGSPGPGLPPLGPFYEIETSSPAAALKPGEAIRHVQRTLHLTGPEEALDAIAKSRLGVGIARIQEALP